MRYGRKIKRNPGNWYASFTEDGDRWYIGPVSMEEANDRAAFFETLNKKRVSFGTSKPKGGRHLPSVLPIENVRNLIRQKGLPVPSAGGYSYLSSYRDQKRKNPLFKRKPSPKFAVGNAVAFKSGGATGVVLDKQWWDGAWHYEISWPKGYSSKGTTTEHEGLLRHVQRNPLGGPLVITHNGPDLQITHKANPSNRWGQSFKKGDMVSYRGDAYTYVKLAPASDFSRAYGRQAILKSSDGYETKAGLDDLSLVKANPHRSRSVASKISSSRIPWRTMTSAEIEAVVQEAAAAGDKKLLSRYRRHKKR